MGAGNSEEIQTSSKHIYIISPKCTPNEGRIVCIDDPVIYIAYLDMHPLNNLKSLVR